MVSFSFLPSRWERVVLTNCVLLPDFACRTVNAYFSAAVGQDESTSHISRISLVAKRGRVVWGLFSLNGPAVLAGYYVKVLCHKLV